MKVISFRRNQENHALVISSLESDDTFWLRQQQRLATRNETNCLPSEKIEVKQQEIIIRGSWH